MTGFSFVNDRPAVDYKEPQVGKKELLGIRPSRLNQTSEEGDVKPVLHKDGFGSRLSSNTWSFGALDDDLFTTHAPSTSTVQPKKNAASPRAFSGAGFGSTNQKRASGNESFGQPAAKKSKHTAVVDLTSDVEDDDIDHTGEPRGRSTNSFSRAQANSLASTPASTQARTTFRRGLSPYAAHKRKPAETHRAKPPIKPQDYSQVRQSNPAAPQKHSVFSREPSSTASPSPAPATPAGLAGRLLNRPTNASPKKAKRGGPFEQDSSDDEKETATKQKTRASSVTFLNSRRDGTPARNAKQLLLQQSQAKRQQANAKHAPVSATASATAPGSVTPATTQAGWPDDTAGKQAQAPTSDEGDASGEGSFLGIPRQG